MSALIEAYSRFIDDARGNYKEDMERIRSREWAKAHADRLVDMLDRSAPEHFSRAAVVDALQESVSRFGEEDFTAILSTLESALRLQFEVDEHSR